MLMHLLMDHPMSADIETDWIIPEEILKGNKGNTVSAIAVQLVWKDVTGDYQAEIDIVASLFQEAESPVEKLIVNSYNNAQNSEILIINPAFRMLKIRYGSNGTPSGKLNAYMRIS